MSDAAPGTSWPVLSFHERRILGVLVEKAKTTPDIYPLSLNALVTGCNQKSNRDPVLSLNDEQVEETLEDLQKQRLVSRVTGGRVDRWRHHLYEVWNVGKIELAILAELLLRGAQTEGELRARASRMEPIDDLEALRPVLATMKERGLVVFLGPEGKRGTTLTHGFNAPQDLERLRAAPRPEPEAAAAPPTSTSPTGTPDKASAELAQARAELASLREQVTQLQQALASLTEQVRNLKESLGT
jgi:uncharacterized protein